MLTVSPVRIVAVLTVIGILRQPADLGGGTATGLILGNLLGSLAATVAYLLVTLLPSPAFLLLVVLLVGLIFGDRIARGEGQAPIYTVSLMTFLIVLGLGLSPLPQDSGDIFISRVFDVMVAGAYAQHGQLASLGVSRALSAKAWCSNPLTLCQSGTPSLLLGGCA